MLEKLGLATAITFSLYLLVKVPSPAGPKLGDHQTLSHQIVSASQTTIAVKP